MKGKITDNLRPQLTKKPSEVWDKNISSWISEVKLYQETVANEQSQNGRGEYQIDGITYANGGLMLMVKCHKLWTLKPKLWTSQIWTLINNLVIVLVCAKCSAVHMSLVLYCLLNPSTLAVEQVIVPVICFLVICFLPCLLTRYWFVSCQQHMCHRFCLLCIYGVLADFEQVIVPVLLYLALFVN